jgi:hypothetical protein
MVVVVFFFFFFFFWWGVVLCGRTWRSKDLEEGGAGESDGLAARIGGQEDCGVVWRGLGGIVRRFEGVWCSSSNKQMANF